ncbi:MAG: hypothetical protein AB1656_11230 [Candidatus Omnitrophota bacterium]
MHKADFVSFESILSGKSFKDLILLKDGKLDLSRFDALMRGVLEESARSTQAPAHRLVRVIRDGRVMWTTVEQAKQMIEYHRHHSLSDESENIANQIEIAINGDINHLEDEMLILLCMAESGHKDNAEVLPKLDRRRKDVLQLAQDVRQSESDLARKKRDTKVVDAFEEKLGLMINARSHGDEKRATELAMELRLIKSKYLLFARSLSPDIQKIRQLRGDLVRSKEKVLGHILDCVASETQSLSLTLDTLKQNMQNLESAFQKAASSSTKKDEDEEYNSLDALKERMSKVQSAIQKKTERIEILQQESAALKQEIENTRTIADKIGSAIVEDGVDEQLKKFQSQTPKIQKSPGLDSLLAKKASSRMHVEPRE